MVQIMKQFIKKCSPNKLLIYIYKVKCKNEIRKALLQYKCKFSKTEKIEYEAKFKKLNREYEKIVIYSFCTRHIGEMCLTMYLYMLENKCENKTLSVFFPLYALSGEFKIPNEFLFDKFKEKVFCITKDNIRFWKYCIETHKKNIEISSLYSWEIMKDRSMNFIDKDIRKDEIVSFSAKEKKAGSSEKERMGLHDRYICFYARDNSYYQKVLNDYSDTVTNKYRNSNIENCLQMTQAVFKNGFHSVRMGYMVEKELAADGVVDYATIYRSEFMDINLIAGCEFFVCGGSGIQLVASLFSIPQVMINLSVISFSGDMVVPATPRRDLIIIKKYWDKNRKRYLTFREIFAMEERFSGYNLFEEYYKRRILPIENTPEEICDVVEEMQKRIRSEMYYNEEDELLQSQYREILKESIKKSGNLFYNARIGTEFLKKNKWLLE